VWPALKAFYVFAFLLWIALFATAFFAIIVFRVGQ
jgi:hypothetical protein